MKLRFPGIKIKVLKEIINYCENYIFFLNMDIASGLQFFLKKEINDYQDLFFNYRQDGQD